MVATLIKRDRVNHIRIQAPVSGDVKQTIPDYFHIRNSFAVTS